VTDHFEAYYPRQQAKYLQSKLWILNIFGEQNPLEHLGSNLKDDQHSFISRIKHTEFWERTLDGLRKYLETVPLPRGTLVDFSPETKLQVPRIEI